MKSQVLDFLDFYSSRYTWHRTNIFETLFSNQIHSCSFWRETHLCVLIPRFKWQNDSKYHNPRVGILPSCRFCSWEIIFDFSSSQVVTGFQVGSPLGSLPLLRFFYNEFVFYSFWKLDFWFQIWWKGSFIERTFVFFNSFLLHQWDCYQYSSWEEWNDSRNSLLLVSAQSCLLHRTSSRGKYKCSRNVADDQRRAFRESEASRRVYRCFKECKIGIIEFLVVDFYSCSNVSLSFCRCLKTRI